MRLGKGIIHFQIFLIFKIFNALGRARQRQKIFFDFYMILWQALANYTVRKWKSCKRFTKYRALPSGTRTLETNFFLSFLLIQNGNPYSIFIRLRCYLDDNAKPHRPSFALNDLEVSGIPPFIATSMARLKLHWTCANDTNVWRFKKSSFYQNYGILFHKIWSTI